MTAPAEFRWSEFVTNQQLMYRRGRIVGLLTATPYDLVFKFHKRLSPTPANKLIATSTSKWVETDAFEALSWKEAKRIAVTIARLENL